MTKHGIHLLLITRKFSFVQPIRFYSGMSFFILYPIPEHSIDILWHSIPLRCLYHKWVFILLAFDDLDSLGSNGQVAVDAFILEFVR